MLNECCVCLCLWVVSLSFLTAAVRSIFLHGKKHFCGRRQRILCIEGMMKNKKNKEGGRITSMFMLHMIMMMMMNIKSDIVQLWSVAVDNRKKLSKVLDTKINSIVWREAKCLSLEWIKIKKKQFVLSINWVKRVKGSWHLNWSGSLKIAFLT